MKSQINTVSITQLLLVTIIALCPIGKQPSAEEGFLGPSIKEAAGMTVLNLTEREFIRLGLSSMDFDSEHREEISKLVEETEGLSLSDKVAFVLKDLKRELIENNSDIPRSFDIELKALGRADVDPELENLKQRIQQFNSFPNPDSFVAYIDKTIHKLNSKTILAGHVLREFDEYSSLLNHTVETSKLLHKMVLNLKNFNGNHIVSPELLDVVRKTFIAAGCIGLVACGVELYDFSRVSIGTASLSLLPLFMHDFLLSSERKKIEVSQLKLNTVEFSDAVIKINEHYYPHLRALQLIHQNARPCIGALVGMK